MKIYVLGNLLVEEDSLPVKLIDKLREKFPNIEFVEFDPSEDFPKSKSLTIIDTVLDSDGIHLINDIDKIKLGNIVSLHDFDLGYNLKLMKKFDLLESVNIIGVPPNMKEKKAIKEISKIITSLFSKNE